MNSTSLHIHSAMVPVYYLAPGDSYFSAFDDKVFYSKESARQACIDDPACAGIKELRAKNYALGYKVGPGNGTNHKGLFKQQLPDGAGKHSH